MSSTLDNIYLKMSPAIEPSALAGIHHEQTLSGNHREISHDVAHELNNILTIIRGYAERLVLKHGENPALRPDLQIVIDNARRAEMVIRSATPARPRPAPVAATA
jgi:signal transduction histidine kinase